MIVTGANGFVGAHFLKHWAGGGKTFGLVRRGGALWRLRGAAVTLVRADLRDRAAVRRLVDKLKPRTVFHFAAAGVNPADRKDAAALAKDNVSGTLSLLEALASRSRRLHRVVLVGSCLEFAASSRPLSESAQPDAPDAYGKAKAAVSASGMAYARLAGLPAVLVRPFLIYGPQDHPNRMLPAMMRSALRGEPFLLRSPREVCDLVHVDDVGAACAAAASRPAAVGKTYHVGGGAGLRLSTLKKLVNALVQGRAAPGLKNELSKISRGRVADTRAARKDLGWSPAFPLAKGLAGTLAWHRMMDL